MKVIGLNGSVLIVRKGRGGRSISTPRLPVALPAFHLLEYCLPRLDSVRSDLRLWRDLNWFSGLFRDPARREVLYKSYQVRPLLRRKWVPGRHVRAVQTPPEGVEKIRVQGQSPGCCRAAFEYSQGEVARLRVNPLRVLALAIS